MVHVGWLQISGWSTRTEPTNGRRAHPVQRVSGHDQPVMDRWGGGARAITGWLMISAHHHHHHNKRRGLSSYLLVFGLDDAKKKCEVSVCLFYISVSLCVALLIFGGGPYCIIAFSFYRVEDSLILSLTLFPSIEWALVLRAIWWQLRISRVNNQVLTLLSKSWQLWLTYNCVLNCLLNEAAHALLACLLVFCLFSNNAKKKSTTKKQQAWRCPPARHPPKASLVPPCFRGTG